MKLRHILAALLWALPTLASAQVSFSGSYSENFNSMSTGTAAPTGWTFHGALGGNNDSWTAATGIPVTGSPSAVTAGTANATLVVNSNAGSATATSNTAGYNFALSSSTSNRCIGTSPTSGAGVVWQLRLTNNSGGALSQLSIGYDIRRFTTVSTAEALPGYRLFVSTNSGSSWTNVSALNPVLSGGTVNVPSSSGVTTVQPTAITLPSSVAAGGEIRFRWIDDNGPPSPDQILGLDNVTIQAVNPPTVAITAPADGASFVTGTAFDITATAEDSNGTVTQVEFLRNGVVVGTDATAPYGITELDLEPGVYAYTARATDNDGQSATSPPVTVTVTLDPANLPANTALYFDGVNDHVTLGAAPSLNVGGPPSNGFTMECWFRRDGAGTTASSGSGGVVAVPLFAKGRGEADGDNRDCNYIIGINASGLLVADFEAYPASGITSGQNYPVTGSHPAIVQGRWYHAAATFDGNSRQWTLYLDGRPVGSTTVPAGALPRYDSIQHFSIGTAMNSTGVREGAFHGVIDEVRVWSLARSAAEIEGAMNLEVSAATGLAGRFGLNEGTGSNTVDSVAASTGSLVNGPLWVNGAPFGSILIERTSIAKGAVWKYLDDGTDQGTAWRESAHDDSSWKSGAAPFGFGDSYVQTTLSFGPNSANKYITHYFRRTFEVANPAAIQALHFNILRDDGAVVYINGIEVLRQNMPDGPINYQTLAPVNVEGSAEGVYNFTGVSPAPALVTGTNVIAVELHNRSLSSSDAGFDLEMITLSIAGIPPTVALTAPANEASFNLGTEIQLAADANDTDGSISKVEFYVGNTKLGEATEAPYTFTWSGMISGAYALTARATDNEGNTMTSSVVNITVVNPSNQPPLAAITAPADGTIFTTNSTQITATASDSDGVVTKVEFFANSSKLGEDLTAPYTFNWTNVSGGTYVITAVATDNDGATTTSAPVNLSFAVPVQSTEIAKGSTWRYLDNGSDQGTVWRESAFDDSTWASGAGPLGYGDTHIVTTVNSGPSGNRIITTYLRRTFNITNASAVQSLLLNIMRDDGVVVYINGTEVARQNMPEGTITYLTNASSIVDGSNETTYFASNVTTLPTLNDGANTIAVELHNRDGNSSDLGFDLEMIVSALPGTPPTVAVTSPSAGTSFTAPASITIIADAADSDGTITKVEFFEGTNKLGEVTAEPYQYTWSGVAQGSYTLTARATDNLGVTTSSAGVNVTVNPPDTLPPIVSLTAPVTGATYIAPASIQLAATASDTDGSIAKVEFYNGLNKIGEDSTEPFEFTWSGVGIGSYTITARAIDNLTASTFSEPVVVTVNPNQAPTVTLAAPADGASVSTNGVVKLRANVSDPESAPLAVTFYGRPKTPPPGEDFTLVTIPDTQFYSDSATRFPNFTSQTNWIVASKDVLNTKFVAHMGDMTQNYNNAEIEFQRADQAMGIIENPATTLLTHGIPWGGAPGNHDIGSGGNTSFWNQYFGLSRWAGRPYFGGGYNNTSDQNWQTFSAGGMDFIVVNLMYNSSSSGNAAVLNWADALLKAYPNHRAIVTSHWFIGTSVPPAQSSWGGHGQAVYDKLKVNPNLFLMLCGHIHGEGRRADVFEGRTVNTVLQDYQSRSNGGDSWLRYFTFKPSENKIYAYTYKTNTAPVGNPLGGTFETDSDSQFTLDYNMSATAPWTELGTVNLAAGESAASLDWSGLADATEYEWYAAVSDGVTPVGSSVRSFVTSPAPVADYTLQLLHFADAEAGLLASQTAPNLAALVDAFDDTYANTLILSGGDNFIPGPFAAAGTDALVAATHNKGNNPFAADIEIHNRIGVEASTVGNHEFDFGTNAFADAVLDAEFPYLTANLDFSGDGGISARYLETVGTGGLEEASDLKQRIVPNCVVTKGGQKIGLVGVTTQLLRAISSAGNVQVKGNPSGDDMALLAAQLQPVIDDLKNQGVNKIILMAHLQQIANELMLAPMLRDVDIILAAGSNTRLGDVDDVAVAFPGHAANFAGNYPIYTAGSDGKPCVVVNTDNEFTYLGRLVVDFDADGVILVPNLEASTAINGAYASTAENVATAWGVQVADLPATAFAAGTKGARVKQITDAVQSVINAKDGDVRGYTSVYLEGERNFVRNQETNLGNISADSMVTVGKSALPSATHVVALKNGGGIRAAIGAVEVGSGTKLPPLANPGAGKPEGAVSLLDIENSMRFNNGLMLCETTPAGLKAILEHGVGVLGNQGRFPQIGGMSFSFDSSLPAGSRVRSVALTDLDGNITAHVVAEGSIVAGAPASITLVTLNFLANNGDSYPFKANADKFRYLLSGGGLSGETDESLNFTATGVVPANILGEQAALSSHLQARHATPATAYSLADTPIPQDTRIQQLQQRVDTVLLSGPISLASAIQNVPAGAASVPMQVSRTGTGATTVRLATANGTAGTSPPFAAALAGVDYTAVDTVVEFAEGETSKVVNIPLLPRVKAPNLRFIVSLSQPGGGSSLGAITTTEVRILAPDVKGPTLVIKTPAAAKAPATSLITSVQWPYLITGTAGDTLGLDRVEVVLNGGTPFLATLGTSTKATSIPFSATIEPVEGLNEIVVTAYDLSGNTTTLTRGITFTRRYELALLRTVSGSANPAAGSFTLTANPKLNATALAPKADALQTSSVVPGTLIVLQARPLAGFVFDQWTNLPAGSVVNGDRITFNMPVADVPAIEANFLPNPFLGLGTRAVFQGLITPATGTDSSIATHGSITGSLTTGKGSFSGRIFLNGKTTSFAAVAYGNGSVWFNVGGALLPTFTFDGGRVLDLSIASGVMTATVTDGAAAQESTGLIYPALYSKVSPLDSSSPLLNRPSKAGLPVNQGYYTLVLPAKVQTPTLDAALYPQGDGYLTLTLGSDGIVKFTGVLADKTKVTGSSVLVTGHMSPVFAQLPTPGSTTKAKEGSLGGMLAFDTTASDSDVSGSDLVWIRPSVTEQTGTTALALSTQVYTAGWPSGITVDAVGALYASSNLQASLGLAAPGPDGNLLLRFMGGKLASVVEKAINLSVNTATPAIPKDKTIKAGMNLKMGVFTGTFDPDWTPKSKAQPAFAGALLLKGGNTGGWGHFLSNVLGDSDPESGLVELTPPSIAP